MLKLCFATNRASDPSAVGGFGSALSPIISYGTATLDGAGNPVVDPHVTTGSWSDEVVAQIAAAGLPAVIFIHGLGYKFADVISQCATMKALYAGYGADATYLAFDWCESGQEVGGLFNLEQPYFHSQADAKASAPQIAEFLGQIAALRARLPAACPVMVLAHSMGNFALAGALDLLPAGTGAIFDHVILAAADEQWDSFGLSDSSRLGRLPALTRGLITIYFGRDDGALRLSQSALVNGVQRLGFDGPKGRHDATLFPPDRFRLIDCTADEQGGILNPGETHSYYLTDPETGRDIAMVILGTAGPVGTMVERAA
jgi:esterase/lipase superfamily enzyme